MTNFLVINAEYRFGATFYFTHLSASPSALHSFLSAPDPYKGSSPARADKSVKSLNP